MSEKINLNKEIDRLYIKTSQLWEQLCVAHSKLFDATCEEYSILLSGDIEKLNDQVKIKSEITKIIHELDDARILLINEINNSSQSTLYIDSLEELCEFAQDFERKKNLKHFTSFNRILLDIIQKIQLQNKKNQLYIKKALGQLKQLTNEFSGKKSYSTYSSNGEQVVTSG